MRYKKQFYENAFNIISVELPNIEGLLKETQFRHKCSKFRKKLLYRHKSWDILPVKNAKNGDLLDPKFRKIVCVQFGEKTVFKLLVYQLLDFEAILTTCFLILEHFNQTHVWRRTRGTFISY